jgi:glycerol-3-phosphate dehydrogenase subunit C
VLKLVPGTSFDVIERCSGHDGTYGVKQRFRAASVRIARPVAQRVETGKAEHYASDCPMAGHQIQSVMGGETRPPEHPMHLLRLAYGI